MILIAENLKPEDVPAIVDANKSTNGTDYWHMILTMIAKAFLWIGFFIQVAVFVDVILTPNFHRHRQRQVEINETTKN